MMSCTVHSPEQPHVALMYSSIYSLQSSTQRLPIQALFGFMLKQLSPILPSLSESPSVVVCPRFTLGRLSFYTKGMMQMQTEGTPNVQE